MRLQTVQVLTVGGLMGAGGTFSMRVSAAETLQSQASVRQNAVTQTVAVQAVTITVGTQARQSFAGLGASSGNWGHQYAQLTSQERTTLSRLLWRDLKMKTLRLWMNTDEFAPTSSTRNLAIFRAQYIDSGLIADAQKNGVVNLLLAPDGMPSSMKVKRAGGPNDYALKEEEIGNYAALLADFIEQVKKQTGVLINVTGLQNEPNDLDRIAPQQMAALTKMLRAALDARGLQSVKIVAPESANVDGTMYEALANLKNDAAAWQALGGIASHSYGMAATEEAAKTIAATNGRNAKEYWMTEASDNGAEVPGDALRAASLASRFLSDMNHRVTHWIHFIGFETPDPNDNATRIIAYSTKPLRTTIFQKYYYYRQLSAAFDAGAVFRSSQSDLDGDMTWTYGKKPRLTAAAARNPNGTWSIGLSNFTAPSFSDLDDAQNFALHNSGYAERTFKVIVRVPELAKIAQVRFKVRRSNSGVNDVEQGSLVMRYGQIVVPNVRSLDLVTLRSVRS